MTALHPSPVVAQAAAAASGSRPGRATPPRRPDPAEQLLAAVRRRDARLASLLLQQWVHRRGVASLASFAQQLTAAEGEAAGLWLQQLIDRPLPVVTPAETSASAASAAGPDEAAAPPAPAAERITAELDQAVTAYWQATAPSPVAEVTPADQSSGFAPADTAAQADEAAAQTDEAGAQTDEADAPGSGFGLAARVVAAGRQSFSGLKSLVRDCLDEAIGGLAGGGTPAGAAGGSPRPARPAADRVNRAVTAASQQVDPPAWSSAPASVAAIPAVAAAPGAEPLPGSASPSTVPAPLPWQARSAASSRRPSQPAGGRPAPAPSALSDLRAWLPDGGDRGATDL